ncbi:MAG: hypothetical protein PHV16_03815 [Candidatus Nanoarchaeia archaeon]|nr:hypothetical protein [Candidatus Nanoarchaeia archaeon]
MAKKKVSKESKKETKKTELGLEENIEGLLCYLLTWVSGIVFLLIEKKNNFVRFHAIQSIIVFLPLHILMMIPFIGWTLAFIIGPLTLILWIVLMIKAYQGEKFKIPIAGEIAENQLKK